MKLDIPELSTEITLKPYALRTMSITNRRQVAGFGSSSEGKLSDRDAKAVDAAFRQFGMFSVS